MLLTALIKVEANGASTAGDDAGASAGDEFTPRVFQMRGYRQGAAHPGEPVRGSDDPDGGRPDMRQLERVRLRSVRPRLQRR